VNSPLLIGSTPPISRVMMKAETLEVAKAFWEQAGDPGPFPRNMERAATLALPIAIVKLPRLTVATLASWLRKRGIEIAAPVCEGDMAGCVVAHRGCAAIFVCATDPEDELRATLAHELAHVLRHYLAPRQRVIAALGPDVRAVLDGERPASFAERAKGLLLGVQVGVHVHVLPRDGRHGAIARIENEADELALQLVAPRDAVLDVLRESAALSASARDRRKLLAERFGLPPDWFAVYAAERTGPSDRLGSMLTQLRRSE